MEISGGGGKGGIRIPPIRESVSPGKDFYTYVNGNWQRNAHIPAFSGSYGISEEIESGVRDILNHSLTTLAHKNKDHPITLLSKSIMNAHVQDNNVRDLRIMLRSFDCMRNANDVAREIGKLNRVQARAPLTFSVNADTFHSNMCRVHIYEPVIGLPAKHYYTSKPRNRVILQYGNLLKKVGELLEVDDLESVIPIETSILGSLSEGDALSDPSESYIPLKLTDLTKSYENVPWEEMLLAWGMPLDLVKSSTFILTNEKYAKALNRMFRVFELDTWRVWLRAGLVLSFLEYLPPPFDDLHYELFGKKLRGNAQKLPQHMLRLRVLQTFAPQALSRVFVEASVSETIKEESISMVRRLKSATIHRIRGVKWMATKTKETAVDKIKAMRFQVAYPSVWYNEFNGLVMDPERLIHNIVGLSVRDTDHMIKTIGPGCGESDGTWEDGAFEVNAYYYPDKNQLVIPAGMLRSPFFDLRRSVAWNYGGIGSAIGHEITHGFDADGKNYDLHGNYKDWWTEQDNKMYTKMTKGLIELYDGQDYLGGRVDGSLTLSENIADIGGMSIALDALHSYMKEHKYSKKQELEAYKDFFISYAISWRNKDRPRKARQSLYLDVHSPAPLRVNLVVRQFNEFYEAFGLGPDSPGWIPLEERIQLW